MPRGIHAIPGHYRTASLILEPGTVAINPPSFEITTTTTTTAPVMQSRLMDDTDDPSGLSQYTLYETKV
jgi:hypothetical protein